MGSGGALKPVVPKFRPPTPPAKKAPAASPEASSVPNPASPTAAAKPPRAEPKSTSAVTRQQPSLRPAASATPQRSTSSAIRPLPPPPRVSADTVSASVQLPPLSPLLSRSRPASPVRARAGTSEQSDSLPMDLEAVSARIDLRPIDLSAALGNIESAPIDIEEDAPRPPASAAPIMARSQARNATTRPVPCPTSLAVTRPVPAPASPSHEGLSSTNPAGPASDAWSPPPPPPLQLQRYVDDDESTNAGLPERVIPLGTAETSSSSSSADVLEETLEGPSEVASQRRSWLPAVLGVAVAAAIAGIWFVQSSTPAPDPASLTAAQASMAPPNTQDAKSLSEVQEREMDAAPPTQADEEPAAPSDDPSVPPEADGPNAPGANPGEALAALGGAPGEDAEKVEPKSVAALGGSTLDAEASDAEQAEIDARYQRAVQAYAQSHSQEDLATVAIAACANQDHEAAHGAFRKLVGKDLRSQVVVRCRNVDIDVASSVQRSRATADELVVRAEEALGRGETVRAYKMARASNRRKRTAEAILLMGRASCALGNPTEARSLLRHLSTEERATLVAHCKTTGIEL